MVALDTWFAVAGSLASAMQYLAPIGDVLKMRERGNSTGGVFLPYLLMAANTILWSLNGLILRDAAVLLSSLFGVICSVFFLLTFYMLIRRPSVKERFHKAVAVTSGSVALVVFYIAFLAPRESAALHMGIVCAIAALAMVGASSLRLMLKSGNSESSAPEDDERSRTDNNIVVMATVACFFWGVYGLLIEDLFVALVNGSGFIAGLAQMIYHYFLRCVNDESSSVSCGSNRSDSIQHV